MVVLMTEVTIEKNKAEQTEEQRLKEKIESKIETIFQDNEYGFEAFVTMKSGLGMKRFVLYEGLPERRNDLEVNFKKKIQESLAEVIKTKFLGDDKEYDVAENVADNQKKFYVIKQTDEYRPFAAINLPREELENYRANERDNVEGILFCFERAGQSIWAYQFLYQNSIPNRKGLGFHIVPSEGDVFVEMKKPLLLNLA